MEHVKRIVKGEYVLLEAEQGYALEVKDQLGVLRPQVEIKLEDEWKVKVVKLKPHEGEQNDEVKDGITKD